MGVHSVHIRGAFLINNFEGENISCLSPSMALGRSICFADQVCSVKRKRYPPKESFDLFTSFPRNNAVTVANSIVFNNKNAAIN
jgi:hypothetical protein